jgi:hypothetical protein
MTRKTADRRAWPGLALLAATLLAACGVDGAPEPPQDERPVSISVSGRVEVGVTGGG